MCAQNGNPACGCSTQPDQESCDVDGTPRFVQAITSAGPLKGQVDGGYLVPGAQPGQMMTPLDGGNLALYQDIYGSLDGKSYYYYPGSWGVVHSAGRP